MALTRTTGPTLPTARGKPRCTSTTTRSRTGVDPVRGLYHVKSLPEQKALVEFAEQGA